MTRSQSKPLGICAHSVLSLLLICFSSLLAAEVPVQAFELQFDVSRNGKALGEASIKLAPAAGDTWTFRTHTKGTAGMASLAGVEINETSEFQWRDGHPETLSYAFDQKMRFKSKQRSLSITPNAERVSGRDGDGEYQLSYEPGLVDRNLVVLAMASDLARSAEKLEYRVADKRKIDSNLYRVAGNETLKTSRGALDTIRVERVRKGSGRQTTTWIAPQLGYLPVRIRQIEEDGETMDMQLR